MKRRRKRRPARHASIPFYPRFAIGLVAVAAIATIIAQFWNIADSGGNVSAKPTSVSLRLSGPFGSKFAGEIVAAGAEVFKRNGIDITLREGGDSGGAIAAVVSGADVFGVTDSISFLNARASGQPIVAFAAGFVENTVVFYALEKSGIKAPQDFIGKRVGRQAGSNSAIFYDSMLRSVALARNQMREGPEIDLDALLSDRVDVIPGRIGVEGFPLHQKGAPYTVIRISDYGIHIPDTVYFTTEKFALDQPSLVQRFLQGVIAGWVMAYSDAAKSVPLIVSSGKGLTPEQVQFELAAQRDFVMPLGRRVAEFDEQQWKQLRSILTTARLMDGSVDLKRAINYDILKEAYRKPISFGN